MRCMLTPYKTQYFDVSPDGDCSNEDTLPPHLLIESQFKVKGISRRC